MSFFAELRRRNVIRMAGLYVVSAWLIVQVAETLLPAFDIPPWVLRAIIIVLALGFVPTVVFSWVYELTPDGLRRERDVVRGQSTVDATARKLDVAVIVLLLLVAAMVWLRPAPIAVSNAPAVEAASVDAGDAPGATKSIAVLPFVNMSSDPEQEYFSDGISEEILNVLARQPELRVAARTSSFSFKGDKREVPEIAKALNVRMVLEGSVRKQANQVRITAQLIDANTGYHLWSETYDRELQDLFAIQDEIAAAIAQALQVTLATSEAKAHAGPRNLEAYDLYLRGLALWQTRTSGDALWQAVQLFEQSLAIEPDNLDALTGLALAYGVLADYSDRISFRQADLLAVDYALRALTIDNALPESYAVLGSVMDGQGRYQAAHALFRRSLALRPSYATAYQWLGTSLMSAGQLDEALKAAARASELDPRSPVILNNHAQVLLSLGRYDEAITVCGQALELVQNYRFCLGATGDAELYSGDLARSEASYLRAAESAKPLATDLVRRLFQALRKEADTAAVAAELARFPLQSAIDPASPNLFFEWQAVPLLVKLGQHEIALDYLERLLPGEGREQLAWTVMLPSLDPIRCTPRFQAVISAIDVVDPHFERACTEKSR